MSYNIDDKDLPNLRPIPDFDRYYGGEDGEIYSHQRSGWHRLKLDVSTNNSHPYYRVRLYRDRKSRNFLVHRVIAMAWHGPPTPEKPDVRHLDGNPRNNVPANLQWGTKAENWQDARDHGTAPVGPRNGSKTRPDKILKGDTHPHSKFNETIVAKIKATLLMDRSHGVASELARQYDVTPTAISSIKRGLTWGWVPPALPEGWTQPDEVKLSVAQHAANILKETDNPSVSYHDLGLIHAIADRAGIPHRGPDTSKAVIKAIDRSNQGKLIKSYCYEGKTTRRFWLPDACPDHVRRTRSNETEVTQNP